jgi:hypothetical protein
MNTHIDALDALLTELYREIGLAAGSHDLAGLQRLSKRIAQVEDLKRQWIVSERDVTKPDGNRQQAPFPLPTESAGSLRELAVEVTEGMIRQNLLTLTPHVKRGRIKPGEQLVVEAIPSGERFQTELLEQGNRLRARGEIARFYKDANVSAYSDAFRTAIRF